MKITPEDALPVTLLIVKNMLKAGIFVLRPLSWSDKKSERLERDRARRKKLRESNREEYRRQRREAAKRYREKHRDYVREKKRLYMRVYTKRPWVKQKRRQNAGT